MKELPATNPRSWTFQANMHYMQGTPTNSLFNQCHHGDRLFLAWHRGFLYYFERILRSMSGDPSLMLPYWDWTNFKALPEPFRSPAESTNPLFQDGRAINDGSELSEAIVLDALRTALDQPGFDDSDIGFSSSLEGSPHGTVHTAIGGIMGSVPTAANDPIFWLHHCNIDRMWDYWLNLGNGRVNLSDPAYLDTTFSYANEEGATVTHRIRDILDSRGLGYRYDSVPNPPSSKLTLAMVTAAGATLAPVTAMHAMEEPKVAAVGANEPSAPKPLGLKTETLKVTPAPVRARVRAQAVRSIDGIPVAAAPIAPPRTLVTVNDIEFDKVPEISYGIYLNVPEGTEPSDAMVDHLVGMINFFGRDTVHPAGGHGVMAQARPSTKRFSQSFDATRVIGRLRAKGLYKDGEPARISLRPIVSKPPADPNAAEAAKRRVEVSVKEANVRYGSVKIDPNG